MCIRKLLQKRRLRKVFLDNHRALEGVLDATRSLQRSAERTNLEDVLYVINVNQFVAICNFDISILAEDLLLTEPGWRRKLYARLVAITIVEFMEDIAELLGKDFRDKLDTIAGDSVEIEELSGIGKKLSRLRKEHEKELRSIRNIAIGHRDKNARVQLELIDGLDVNNLVMLAIAIIEWQTSLVNFIVHLLESVPQDLRTRMDRQITEL